jgi:hypothetical protein
MVAPHPVKTDKRPGCQLYPIFTEKRQDGQLHPIFTEHIYTLGIYAE